MPSSANAGMAASMEATAFADDPLPWVWPLNLLRRAFEMRPVFVSIGPCIGPRPAAPGLRPTSSTVNGPAVLLVGPTNIALLGSGLMLVSNLIGAPRRHPLKSDCVRSAATCAATIRCARSAIGMRILRFLAATISRDIALSSRSNAANETKEAT